MTSHLVALAIAAHDPQRLATFWAGLLRVEPPHHPGDGVALPAGDLPRFRIRVEPTDEPKEGPNRIHLHLTSTSLEDQQRTVARALQLGGRHLDVGQRPEEGHVVLADPEGNELCVIEPGNSYLDGCGFLGELACDGAREVGYFWSEALGWPLVWDQDEESAIQSPAGGTKIAWGGPPETPKARRNRLRLDVAPPLGGDQEAEVDRLVALGAARVGTGRGDGSRVPMTDPGGNEFCLLPPRDPDESNV